MYYDNTLQHTSTILTMGWKSHQLHYGIQERNKFLIISLNINIHKTKRYFIDIFIAT